MQELDFIASFPIRIKVFKPNYGGDLIEIFVGDLKDGGMWREGTMHKKDGAWIFDMKKGSILTAADILILGDMLDEQINEELTEKDDFG